MPLDRNTSLTPIFVNCFVGALLLHLVPAFDNRCPRAGVPGFGVIASYHVRLASGSPRQRCTQEPSTFPLGYTICHKVPCWQTRHPATIFISSYSSRFRRYSETNVLPQIVSFSSDEQWWIEALASCKHPNRLKRFLPPTRHDTWSMDGPCFFRKNE